MKVTRIESKSYVDKITSAMEVVSYLFILMAILVFMVDDNGMVAV